MNRKTKKPRILKQDQYEKILSEMKFSTPRLILNPLWYWLDDLHEKHREWRIRSGKKSKI